MILTLAQYKKLQSMPNGPSPLDELITGCIASAEAAIEGYCSRFFTLERRTSVVDGSGRLIILPAYPISEVHSVTCFDRTLDDVIIDAERGMLYRISGWPYGVRNVTVDYSGGYTDEKMPASVVHAVAMLTKQMVGLVEDGGQTALSERLGDYQVTYGRNMVGGGAGAGSEGGLSYFAPTVAALLRPYMLHRV